MHETTELQQPGVICMSFNYNKSGWPLSIALRCGPAHVESEAADLLTDVSCCPQMAEEI